MKLSRRSFLVAGIATTGGLLLGQYALKNLRELLAENFEDYLPGEVQNLPAAASWLIITPENRVLAYLPKVEMGQGIHTALGQIIVEELGITWEQLEVRQATPAEFPDREGTQSSNSVRSLYFPLRRAAAAMRAALAHEASNLLGTAVTPTWHGAFTTSDGQTITYAEVAQQGHFETTITSSAGAAVLKKTEEFQHIGQSVPRLDLLDKVTGKAVYGYTYKIPEMLYGAVLSPPTFNGKFEEVETTAAQALPGVVKVVVNLEHQLVGVVALNREIAQQALSHLHVTWANTRQWQQEEIDAIVTVGNSTGVVVQEVGNQTMAPEITAEYRTAMAAHAHLEPQSALADVRADTITLYASTQFPWETRRVVADSLGYDEEQVIVHPTLIGGGFGNKLNVQIGVEAALLSQAVGRPVHLSWSRAADLRRSYFRPPTHHILRGRVENGRMQLLEHEMSGGDIGFTYAPVRPLIEFAFGADAGTWIGATVHRYDVPQVMIKAWRAKIPINTGWWRGLGLLPNLFAVESFVDEMAHLAQVDPLTFRLNHLAATPLGKRFQRVLETVAELSEWGAPLPAGWGRGVACGTKIDTVVAQVAELSVENGRIHIHKFFAAVDAGLIINPDSAIAQVESAIIMGIGSTLYEEVRLKDGQLNISNFHDYQLPTMLDTPEIAVKFVGEQNQPYGLGEPPIGPVPAAIGNALFMATGQRFRQLPIKL